MPKTAWNCPVVICAYNRPNYFKRCLDSVIAMPEVQAQAVPVYVFCDGGEESKQAEISKIIDECPIPVRKFFQTVNLCIPKHMHYIRSAMFEREQRDRFMFLEEDIVVSKYYYRFMNRVLDIYEANDPTVVIVNSCVVCRESLELKLKKQRDFSDALSHLNNFVMSQRAWRAIKPVMDEYIERFITPAESYRTLNHFEVMNWAREKLATSDAPQARQKRTTIHLTSSQDSITNMALRIQNFRYVCSYVNRILNIGEEGYHYQPEYFKQYGLDEVVLDPLPMDENEFDTIWDMDAFCELKI